MRPSDATGNAQETGSEGTTQGSDADADADSLNSDEGSAGTTGEDLELEITALEAAARMGTGFNLGQMFENSQHPPTLAAAKPKIDAYYERGFRLVRIPITWTEHAEGDLLVHDPATGDVDREHPRLQQLIQIVDDALSKKDMFVIINAHHEKTLKTESRSAVLERLWADIAEIFADRSHRLIFEILNEPHRNDNSPMPAADLRDMTRRAYAKIRAIDEQRIVVIGGNQWFDAAEMAAVWPNLEGVGDGRDPFVMATFHHYDPWSFCGDNQGTYDDAWTDTDLASPMDAMLAWANGVGQGMPVFIGEWGVGWGSRYSAMECNNIRLWYQNMVAVHAIPRGLPTAVWDDGGWFAIYDHASDTFANNLVDCILGECEWSDGDRFNEGCL